jgi:mitochondrial intermediate peptidase
MALSRLFKHLYGISFRPVDAAPGELWHPDVRKLEVVDEKAGVVGWIYADLYARRGKASGAAHYTVRCSRRTDNDDPEADVFAPEHMDRSVDLSMNFDRDHRARLRGIKGEYQLPVVVLLCEFMPPSSTRPSMLQWHDVQTLFHEMGHAMHCMSHLCQFMFSRS